MRLVSSQKTPAGSYLLRIEITTGFFKKKKEIYEVRGSGTVWHYHPHGHRCSTPMEAELCDIWQTVKWKEEDETEAQRKSAS